MANAAEVEAVDFEPEDDDLMDEDGGVDAADAAASPRAPLPKLKSAITGGASSSAAASRKIKGRGFRQDHPDAVDRSARLAASNFDSLKSPDGPGPQRCQSPSLSLFLLFTVLGYNSNRYIYVISVSVYMLVFVNVRVLAEFVSLCCDFGLFWCFTVRILGFLEYVRGGNG